MTMSKIGRSVRWLGFLALLATLPAAPSRAQEDEAAGEFVGYDAVGSGTAMTTFPKVPALLPFDAPFEATVALATATLSSGGQGFGRASTFFPGTPIAGIRPLIEIAGAPSTPIPDYPVVVESREFEDSKHNEQPGITMSSDVDPDRAVVIADAGGFALPGVMRTASSRTVSTSLLEPGLVSGSSTSTVYGVDIGGLVKIDSISSTATVTSDATASVCAGTTTVKGATVAGQPATLDGEGLHVAEQQIAPGVSANPGGDALAASGIKMRVLEGAAACDGPNGSRSTPGVLVSIPLPEAGSLPPGGEYIMILASATATAGASTLPAFEPPPFDPPTVIGDVVPLPPGPADGVSGLAPVEVPASPDVADPGPAAPPLTGVPAADVATYTFGGVPVALVLGLFYIAIPGARRVRRYVLRVMTLVNPA